jgi:hypothetical protein
MDNGTAYVIGALLGVMLGCLGTLAIQAINGHGEQHQLREQRDQVYNEAVRRGFGEYNNGNFVWEKAYDRARPTIGTKDVVTPLMLEKAAQ